MLDWLLQLRAFVGDGIAQWRNLRVDGLQYPHRLETRLMVIGLVGVMLILVIGRLAMKRRAGRDQIVLPGLPASIRASRGSSMAHLPLVLFLIGLGFFAVALGDPHTPFFTSDVSFPGRRIAIVVDASSHSEDAVFEAAIEAGAEDVASGAGEHVVTVDLLKFHAVKEALERAGVTISSAELTRVPKLEVSVSGKQAGKLIKLLEALEEIDDVQKVHTNADIDEAVLATVG